MEDFAAVLEGTQSQSLEGFPEYLEELFRSRYTNPEEAAWKLNRIRLAYTYLFDNLEAFERESWLIRTTENILPNNHLIEAFWRFFSWGTDEQARKPPAASVFARMAEEQRKLLPPN